MQLSRHVCWGAPDQQELLCGTWGSITAMLCMCGEAGAPHSLACTLVILLPLCVSRWTWLLEMPHNCGAGWPAADQLDGAQPGPMHAEHMFRHAMLASLRCHAAADGRQRRGAQCMLCAETHGPLTATGLVSSGPAGNVMPPPTFVASASTCAEQGREHGIWQPGLVPVAQAQFSGDASRRKVSLSCATRLQNTQSACSPLSSAGLINTAARPGPLSTHLHQHVVASAEHKVLGARGCKAWRGGGRSMRGVSRGSHDGVGGELP